MPHLVIPQPVRQEGYFPSFCWICIDLSNSLETWHECTNIQCTFMYGLWWYASKFLDVINSEVQIPNEASFFSIFCLSVSKKKFSYCVCQIVVVQELKCSSLFRNGPGGHLILYRLLLENFYKSSCQKVFGLELRYLMCSILY